MRGKKEGRFTEFKGLRDWKIEAVHECVNKLVSQLISQSIIMSVSQSFSEEGQVDHLVKPSSSLLLWYLRKFSGC